MFVTLHGPRRISRIVIVSDGASSGASSCFEGVEGLCLTAICALLLFALGPGVDQLKNLLPYAPLAYSILTAIVLSDGARLVAVSLPAPAFARTGGALHRAETTQAAQ